MRFLADEHVPPHLVTALRARGHAVVEVRETDPGLSDLGLLRRSQAEERVVLTRDKGFGSLVFRSRARASGVILVRRPLTIVRAEVIADVLDAGRERWRGRFSVIEHDRIRSTPIQ